MAIVATYWKLPVAFITGAFVAWMAAAKAPALVPPPVTAISAPATAGSDAGDETNEVELWMQLG